MFMLHGLGPVACSSSELQLSQYFWPVKKVAELAEGLSLLCAAASAV
jgi:hypothetical protein